MTKGKAHFTYIDLFAGIGGFHAALKALGGECVYAVEIDQKAAKVYERNWGLDPYGDITLDVTAESVRVPPHDVLVAGFPCQPFSKSGAQMGMDETRGTLYWNILRIIQEHHPALIVLENVRNLAGPRHRHEWEIIVKTLREEGYSVASEPAVFSPHLLPRDLGGRPQVRERVFVVAVLNKFGIEVPDIPILSPHPYRNWEPQDWNLQVDLPLQHADQAIAYQLSESEIYWISAWNQLVEDMWELRDGRPLPGFPLWSDDWVTLDDLEIPLDTPNWKKVILRKNAEFFTDNFDYLSSWLEHWRVRTDRFPPSRRKLEWQAQMTPTLWDAVMHFRPSGIRAKKPNYLPALVAITQTSILGSQRRRITPREAARLQGLPEWFDFGDQPDSATYRQLGNGVCVGVVWHVLLTAILKYESILEHVNPSLIVAVRNAPDVPDTILTGPQH